MSSIKRVIAGKNKKQRKTLKWCDADENGSAGSRPDTIPLIGCWGIDSSRPGVA